MYQMRKNRMGTISKINVHAFASVCHKILPIPTEAASAIRTLTPVDRVPVRVASSQAAQAARRKDTFVTAFSGSANNPGPIRSQ